VSHSQTPADEADDLSHLLLIQDGVISRAQALRYLSAGAIRHLLESTRWRRAHHGVYLTHTGRITKAQRRWVAVLSAGTAIVGGVTALELLGLRGFHARGIHVLMSAQCREKNPPAGVVVHRTRHLPAGDVHRVGRPPCTMPARSLVDAAQWAGTDEQARAVIAASFRQKLLNQDDLEQVIALMPRARRRALIVEAAADARAGARSGVQAGFLRLCRRHCLPEPTCRVRGSGSDARQRHVGVYFEQWRLRIEIDDSTPLQGGAGWTDMKRQNDLWLPSQGVLVFPGWAVRHRPAEVVAQVRAALTAAGYSEREPHRSL
jgi:hypothetical protein